MTYHRKYNFTPRYLRSGPFKRIPLRGTFVLLPNGVQPFVKVNCTQGAQVATMINPRHPYRCLATGKPIFIIVNTLAPPPQGINTICYVPHVEQPNFMASYDLPQNAPCMVLDHPFND